MKKRRINRQQQRENLGLLLMGLSMLAVTYYILFVMGGSITW